MPEKLSKKARIVKELSPLEREIMEVVWREGRVTAKQVKETLDSTRPLALTTILTVLRRLKNKKYVKEVPSLGRSIVFKPAVSRELVIRRSIKELLKQFFSGSPSALMAHLLKNENISDKELSSPF